MPNDKFISGTPITDDDPLQVVLYDGSGNAINGTAVTVPVNNGAKAMTTASAEIFPAAADGVTARDGWIENTASARLHLGFGEAATTLKFSIAPGGAYKTTYLGEVNGILASGTGNINVIAEAR